MSSFSFYYELPDRLRVRIDAEVDEYGELSEYDVVLEKGKEEYSFYDRLTEAEEDAIVSAIWSEYTTYIEDRRARV